MRTIERKPRDPRLDVIRLTALFFVCATHFFLYSGYNDVVMEGPVMFVMTAAKSLFRTCVPIFITLTGYLMCEKKLSLRYFKGIIRVLAIYVVFSVVYTVYAREIIHDAAYGGTAPQLLLTLAEKLLNYSAVPYGW